MGKVEDVDFKASGKQILDGGWRVLYPKVSSSAAEEKKEDKEEESILPPFEKGERGVHAPVLTENRRRRLLFHGSHAASRDGDGWKVCGGRRIA